MQSNKPLSVLLFLIAFAVYGNTIPNKFAMDDFIVLTNNTFVQKGMAGIKDIFTHDSFGGVISEASSLTGGRYRPLSIASFAIEQSLFGKSPSVFHFFNVFFFALSVVVIFRFLTRIFSLGGTSSSLNYHLPFFASLIFAVLPVHTEVIANIKGRDEIYALLFGILTFHCLIPKEVKENKTKNLNVEKEKIKSTELLLAGLSFLLALLSKESVIPFILIIPLGLFLFTNNSNRKTIVSIIPILIASGLYMWMRFMFTYVPGERAVAGIITDPFVNAGAMQRLATIALVQLKYLQLIIFPLTLSSDYSFNQVPLTGWNNPMVILSVLIHIGLLSVAVINFKRNRIVSFSIFFYLISFTIVSNLFFSIGAMMAERFTYIPSLGICILVAYAIMKILKVEMTGKPSMKTFPVTVVVLLVLISAFRISARNKDWKDDLTLFGADAVNSPNSARTHFYYGIQCYKESIRTNNPLLFQESLAQIRTAIKIYPEFTDAWNNLGTIYRSAEKYAEALECYKKVLQLDSLNEQGLYGVGYCYGRGFNQPLNAIPYFEKLLSDKKAVQPEYFEGAGICYAATGNYRKAIDCYTRGISINPKASKLYYNAAISYRKLGIVDSSEIYFAKAEELERGVK